MKTVRFLDVKTGSISTIPVAELSPSCFPIQRDGTECHVFINGDEAVDDSTKTKVVVRENPIRHDRLNHHLWPKFFKVLADALQEVLPLDETDWEDFFRRKEDPMDALERMRIITQLYLRFVKTKQLSIEAKRDYFTLLLHYSSSGDTALYITDLSELTTEEAKRFLTDYAIPEFARELG